MTYYMADLFSELIKIDQKLFVAINSTNNAFWDIIMVGISNKYIWIPLYILLGYLLIRRFGMKGLWFLLAAIIAIAFSDLLSVHLFKNTICRLRPCHHPLFESTVHLVNARCGGLYGFISSHASNHAVISSFVITAFGVKRNWQTLLLLSWVVSIAYSRVYLGVHYPADVLSGIIFGSLIGVSVCLLTRRIIKLLQEKDKPEV